MKTQRINDPYHNPFHNRFHVPVHSRLDEMQAFTHMVWLNEQAVLDHEKDNEQAALDHEKDKNQHSVQNAESVG